MSGKEDITIWGILVGAILPLLGYLVFHWLATAREGSSRKAKATNDFRESIIRAVSVLPEVNTHWGNEVTSSFPSILQEINTASEIYKYFLNPKERVKFKRTLMQLENLLKTHLPSSLSAPNIMYPGEQRTAEQAKTELNGKIEELKSYASKT